MVVSGRNQYFCNFSAIFKLLNIKGKKGKVLPYSLPSVGPRADPGVQAVRLQVTFKSSPGGRLPKNVTVLRPVPSYTAW